MKLAPSFLSSVESTDTFHSQNVILEFNFINNKKTSIQAKQKDFFCLHVLFHFLAAQIPPNQPTPITTNIFPAVFVITTLF